MNTEPNDKQSNGDEAGQLRQAVVVPSAPLLVFRQEGSEGHGHLDGYDDDDWRDVQDDDEVIIGYECLGCGHTQATDGWGGRCDRCDGLSLEAMYY
jgi:hypothetical protein